MFLPHLSFLRDAKIYKTVSMSNIKTTNLAYLFLWCLLEFDHTSLLKTDPATAYRYDTQMMAH